MYHRYLQDFNNIHFFFPNKSAFECYLVMGTSFFFFLQNNLLFKKWKIYGFIHHISGWIAKQQKIVMTTDRKWMLGSKTEMPLELKPAKYKNETKYIEKK